MSEVFGIEIFVIQLLCKGKDLLLIRANAVLIGLVEMTAATGILD